MRIIFIKHDGLYQTNDDFIAKKVLSDGSVVTGTAGGEIYHHSALKHDESCI